MKRILIGIVYIYVILLLTGCFKSEEVKMTEALIAEIGEITIDNEEVIIKAEEAYALLTEKEQKKVENYSNLQTARNIYSAMLVDESINNIKTVTTAEKNVKSVEAVRKMYEELSDEGKALVTALPKLEVFEADLKTLKEFESLIDSIGKVTSADEEKIKHVKENYENLPANIKTCVSNKDKLEKALTQLDKLIAIEKAIAVLPNIPVTDSEKILKVKEMYYDLDASVRMNIVNINIYNEKMQELEEYYKTTAAEKLQNMKMTHDKVRGMKFYYPPAFYFYSDGWAADRRCFVLPYIGMEGDDVWMRLIYNYTDDDWLFFEKIIIAADNKRHNEYFKYYDIVRDNGGGDIWEYIDVPVYESELEILRDIAESKETIVRFEGDDYYDDYIVPQSDKDSIKMVLDVYEMLTFGEG